MCTAVQDNKYKLVFALDYNDLSHERVRSIS